jgi:hypothetical protein
MWQWRIIISFNYLYKNTTLKKNLKIRKFNISKAKMKEKSMCLGSTEREWNCSMKIFSVCDIYVFETPLSAFRKGSLGSDP